MENFPKHVCIAETRTGGNPDILSDPNIVPQKKPTPAAEIFGPPTSQKKKIKGTPGRKSKGGSPGILFLCVCAQTPNKTHPFLFCNFRKETKSIF